jgi:Ca2+-binding RTX toxin-like protein
MIISITNDGDRFLKSDAFASVSVMGYMPQLLLDWSFSKENNYYEEKTTYIGNEKLSFVGYFSYDNDIKIVDNVDVFNVRYEKVASIVDIFVPVGSTPVDSKNDQFYLGSERDIVIDGGGNDYIDLGAGNDLFVYSVGKDKVYGGQGLDRVDLAPALVDKLTFKAVDDDWIEFRSAGDLFLSTKYVERVNFGTDTLALDMSGPIGQVFRLYQAAFDREPDKEGLGYWIRLLDAGKITIDDIVKAVGQSKEFSDTFGAMAGGASYVDALYKNILGRDSDAAGRQFWIDSLANGLSGEQLFFALAHSDEFKLTNAASIIDGIWYT